LSFLPSFLFGRALLSVSLFEIRSLHHHLDLFSTQVGVNPQFVTKDTGASFMGMPIGGQYAM
jgi:hypothetical protein